MRKLQFAVFAAALGLTAPVFAQQSDVTINPGVRDALKDSVRPSLVTPKQEELGRQLRVTESPMSREEQLEFARWLAEYDLVGIGEPTHLELNKGQLSVENKLSGRVEGYVRFGHDTNGVQLRQASESVIGRFRLNITAPRKNAPKYFLAEVYYTSGTGSMGLSYVLNGNTINESVPLESATGTVSILIDNGEADYWSTDGLSISGRDVTLKAITVSPVG